jgi:hypothetical protein
MDFGMLMMSQGLPNGMLPGMNTQQEGLVPTGANAAEFVNLLDIVEGMEIGEMSSASDKELNFAAVGENLSDKLTEKVASDKNAALAGLAMAGVDLNAGLINKSVGQEMLAKAPLEMDPGVANEIATPQDLFLNAPMPRPVAKTEAPLTTESVAAWTTAFAAGELKEIDVSKAVPEGSDLSPQKALASAKAEVFSEGQGIARETKVADVPVMPQSQNDKQPSREGSQKNAQPEQGFVSMASTVERVSKNDTRVVADAAAPLVNEKASQEGKKNESVQAKDFFLDRSLLSPGQSGFNSGSVLASAVASKGSVTKPSDQNVVDFVSDKIVNLQQAGGGTLRVGLDTKDMGQIEIKVSLRGGRVDVRISGESSELTRQLEGSRAELAAKLEKHVELGDLNIANHKMSRTEGLGQALSSGGASLKLTEDLVRNAARDGVDAASNLEMPRSERLESLRADAPIARSQESATMNRGFARDERRDQAMNQWANFSQLRQSA